MHGKLGSQSSIVNEKAVEGISMFARIDKKAKEVKYTKDQLIEIEIDKSKKGAVGTHNARKSNFLHM